MKAWVLHKPKDIRLEEVEKPQPQAGEVLLRVKAAGICGSDIPRIYDTGAHVHPLIPGHEFAGNVVEITEGVDPQWLGARVSVFPLLPCRECGPCRMHKYELCRNYGYIGSRRDGAFAEYVRVPVWNLIRIPDSVSFENAAMLEPMAVAVHAIGKADPKPEETVCVCGLGTIGMFVVMFLLERGVKNLILIGNKEFQKKTALSLGVREDQYIDAKQGNVTEKVQEMTGGIGADVYFEAVGSNTAVSQALDCVGAFGKVQIIGNPLSDMHLDRNTYWKILRNELTVKGGWNSSFDHSPEDDWSFVMETLSRHSVDPSVFITHKFPVERLEEGFLIMRDKTEDYMKIMMVGDD